jgi:hypothetical protein
MKAKEITEFIRIEVMPSTTDDLLLSKADVINEFLQKQDGFIDAELVKSIEGNVWYFIFHLEDFEKVKAVREKIRDVKLFDDLISLIQPNRMEVSFFNQFKRW